MSLGELASWLALAVGAALAGGTAAALVTYRRTGAFPGQPEQPSGLPSDRARIVTAAVKIVLGIALVLAGLGGLIATGTVG